MKEKALKIIEHYGTRNQLEYMSREVFELIEAIIEYEDDIKKEKHNITTEIADVLHFLLQFKEFFNITDEELKKELEYKIDRQLGRIKEESDKE